VKLEGGEQTATLRGHVFDPYLARLRSANAPVGTPREVGSVLDAGEASGGSRDDVRVHVTAPARLVLAESFNEGWRAWCDGDSLGESAIADGWANGWDVAPGCSEVRFEFGPERAVRAGYALSGAACVGLLALLLLRRGRRRGGRTSHAGVRGLPLAPRPLVHAAPVALVLALVVAFVFALRAGAVAFPLLTLILWRGASIAALVGVASLLLGVVVPLLYVAFPPEDFGGYNSGYAGEALAAHWVAVAAFVLLALALWRLLAGRESANHPLRSPRA
jgi:hypothetical protein